LDGRTGDVGEHLRGEGLRFGGVKFSGCTSCFANRSKNLVGVKSNKRAISFADAEGEFPGRARRFIKRGVDQRGVHGNSYILWLIFVLAGREHY
jgi:hypothetical protein